MLAKIGIVNKKVRKGAHSKKIEEQGVPNQLITSFMKGGKAIMKNNSAESEGAPKQSYSK